MDQLLRDAHYALRGMLRAPLLYVVAAASLALGIAANTTIFSALDALLIRPLPYPEADRLLRVWGTNPGRGWQYLSFSVPDFRDVSTRADAIELAGWSAGSMNIAGGTDAERVSGTRVTANLFRVVGIEPALGRGFLPEDAQPGGALVVVISDGLWSSRFGARPDVLGETLVLDGAPHAVVGVLPAGAYFPDPRADIWTPLRFDGTEPRMSRWLAVVGRLHAGAAPERAAEQLAAALRALEQTFPESNTGVQVRIEPLAEALFNDTFRRAAAICVVAVAFVLLIGCANVANLLLARAAAREREIALRTVLGAGRWRIIRQLLTESVVLALVGGGLGVLLSIWGVKWLLTIMPENLPMVDRVALNGRALAFTAAVSVIAGLLFGLAPALQATRAGLASALRDAGARGATIGAQRGRLRSGIVVAEIALAVVLLISAGLLIRGYRSVAGVDVGFRADGIMTGRIALPETGPYADSLRALAFYEELRDRLAARPGVERVTLASALPMTGGAGSYYRIEGMGEVSDAERPVAQYRLIDPAFFETFGVELLEGRSLRAGDRRDGVPVAVVNQSFARRHWPGASALGRQLLLDSGTREIVGVVADYREWGGDEEAPAMFFLPVAQRPAHALALAVRSGLPDASVGELLRAELQALDSNVPLYQVRSMEAILESTFQGDRVLARLLSIFAGMALLLAVIGVYGVMAYSVAQRTREVGIRMAIGADTPSIVRLMLRQGLLLGLTGTLLGVALALAVSRFLAAFLYGVSPFDPLTFIAFSTILLGAALLAAAIPALRAARVDPLVALHTE
ncbi:MAG TPA: ABC transporter permease [Longimicrobiales bacterium]|nr:ABC transporter permease [Longimicrobiales bacterium]